MAANEPGRRRSLVLAALCAAAGCAFLFASSGRGFAASRAQFTLTVSKAGSGAGTVTSSPPGIDCGSTCSHDYSRGTTVNLSEAAGSGSTFTGWSGACSGTSTCSVVMNSAQSVTATFTLLPPKQGKTANASPVKGVVTVNGAPLTGPAQIRTGSVVDTTHGTVEITTAVGHRTQSALFSEGVFRLTQSRHKRGLTTAALVHESTSVCRARVSSGISRKPPRRKKKALNKVLIDGKGHFRSKGKRAAAAAGGTRWLLEDRCDGTWVRVFRDVVTVRDFVRHKTVRLHAGQHYLARNR